MSQPQQSLRKHRQTLVGPVQPKKKSYGELQSSDGSLAVPEVGIKDKQKIGNLVKRRFTTRPTFDPLESPIEPASSLPSNASDLIIAAAGNHEEEPSRSRKQSVIAETATQERRRPSGPVPMPQQQHHKGPSTGPSPGQIDYNAFVHEDFDPKTFISQQLSNSTDVEISKFADKLTSLQVRLNQERKDSMHRNYKTFLKVGVAIVTLGTELETLSKALSELHTTTSAIKEDAEQFMQTVDGPGRVPSLRESNDSLATLGNHQSGSGSLSTRRHSVQMLEEQWAKEMVNLFRIIDGASKYLPVVPGRHIVRESAGWYQLNFVTWKPVQPVHMVLLSDHFLVSTKQRRSEQHNQSSSSSQSQHKKKLVALQCWPLLEMDIIDLSRQQPATGKQQMPQLPSDLARQVISIKAGNVSYVYRAERPESHQMILHEFEKAKSELQKQRNFSPRVDSPRSFTPVERSSTPDTRGHSQQGSINLATATQTLREAEQFIQEIDSKIAYQHFEAAVELIESKKSHISEAVDLVANHAVARRQSSAGSPSQMLQEKVDQRSDRLAEILLNELSQDYVSKAQIVKLMDMLKRLKYAESAKKVFLESRHNQLQSRIKQMEFQGDIVVYISQVAIIYFQIIKSTIEIFMSCFPEPQLSSSIVEWSKHEVDNYILLFARQLYNVKTNTSVYKSCAQITKQESNHLKAVGLDLGFMLEYIYEAIDRADDSENGYTK